MSVFEIKNDRYYLDGKPYRILSGSIHYFRVLPEYWEDRLRKLAACGMNTVETYVPWNAHEPKEGCFDFSGILDLEEFLRTAQRVGLHAVVRPSPYICAEWEFGGLPAWLLRTGCALRCADEVYLEKVSAYYDELMPRLAGLQCTNGGPLLMMQIENEYGSYGNDKTYLRFLEKKMRENGIDIPLFTSDGGCDWMLTGGTLPAVYKTVNFGSDPKRNFDFLLKYQPEYPLMCAEFWNGWFDHWGEEHHTRTGDDTAECFREMLKMGASVNFYMFHGGTNFGWMAGANAPGEREYQPTVTSYDYDCLLSEEGHTTPKYFAVKKVLEEFGYKNDCPVAENRQAKNFGTVRMIQFVPLRRQMEVSGEKFRSPSVKPMEAFGQNYGYILYRTKVAKVGEQPVTLRRVHDRAAVWVNGRFIGTKWRNDEDDSLTAVFDEEENTLEVLVEAMGRVNYGIFLADAKGVTQDIRVAQQFQSDWEIICFQPDDFSGFVWEDAQPKNEPVFMKGTFTVDAPADTYFRADGLHKGMVWVNGFNLGRYWNDLGPQKTLYIPETLLKTGENEIIVLENDSVDDTNICLTDVRDLG